MNADDKDGSAQNAASRNGVYLGRGPNIILKENQNMFNTLSIYENNVIILFIKLKKIQGNMGLISVKWNSSR